MLIKFENLVNDYGAVVTGILHVGAHNCEELDAYTSHGVPADNIYWVEAMPEKVEKMQAEKPGVKIYQAVVSNEDGKTVSFNVASNGQSSSMLDFGSHAKTYPGIRYVKQLELTTTRLATLVAREGIPMETVNFMNLDIQGVELDALKSMDSLLDGIDYVYTEVNTQQVYKGCCEIGELDAFLSGKGFERVATSLVRGAGWGDAFYVKKGAALKRPEAAPPAPDLSLPVGATPDEHIRAKAAALEAELNRLRAQLGGVFKTVGGMIGVRFKEV